MKRFLYTLVILILFFGLNGCNSQQQTAVEETPKLQEIAPVLEKDADVAGFHSGTFYVLSVRSWGNSARSHYSEDAFKKLETQTTKIEQQGWLLQPDSIRISQSDYCAWIVATFREQ